jgi:hypothetical protein
MIVWANTVAGLRSVEVPGLYSSMPSRSCITRDEKGVCSVGTALRGRAEAAQRLATSLEPASIVLLGTGLFLVARVARRYLV